ncbi:MAG: GntR family transcriptional regulator [Acidobacteria bacterium]|nr:GntR family transcriptional regulator [Acidobacteriota bacterium]
MELARLNRARATDEVYDALRQAVLSHLFQPGERLQVGEISAKLGVSPTPVRHAIQRLASEGLIEIRPRSGTFVASLTVPDIEETFEIRCALECLAAETAVLRLVDTDLARLRELLDVLREPIADEASLRRHEQANSEFHAVLLRASGNRRLQEIHESLKANIQIARVHVAEGYRGARWQQEQAEHEEIYAAAAARNTRALQDALRRHILRARQSLVATLRGSAHA